MHKFLFVFLAFVFANSTAHAQTELKAYADKNGYLNANTLTCDQLANTFQEDANFLGVWYSGWYNGLAKKSSIDMPRVKEGIHRVILYCEAHRDIKIIQALDAVLKEEKANRAK